MLASRWDRSSSSETSVKTSSKLVDHDDELGVRRSGQDGGGPRAPARARSALQLPPGARAGASTAEREQGGLELTQRCEPDGCRPRTSVPSRPAPRAATRGTTPARNDGGLAGIPTAPTSARKTRARLVLREPADDPLGDLTRGAKKSAASASRIRAQSLVRVADLPVLSRPPGRPPAPRGTRRRAPARSGNREPLFLRRRSLDRHGDGRRQVRDARPRIEGRGSLRWRSAGP
jgi:hypothetical protein